MSSQARHQRQDEARSQWRLGVRQLQAARSCFRLWANGNSPFVWVRKMRGGEAVERFSAAPLRRDSPDDVIAAVGLCLASERAGRWCGTTPRPQRRAAGRSWPELAEQVAAEVIEAIPKEGSRVHLLNDLRKRIASFPGEPTAEALCAWVEELDPLRNRRSFTRRLEVLSWIDRVRPEMGIGASLPVLRAQRPRGAAQRLAAAQGMRVRVVPSDAAIEQWLDGLDPFNQWVFAALAAYGLRPHELWHCDAPDEKGWVTIPGEMRTKSARAHFAPPVPHRWLERYRLAEQWPLRQQELLARWPVRWEMRGELAIPVNNAALGQYLRKQFALRGVEPLVAPVAEGEGTDWARPYDLRHSYAIRCATSPECARVAPEDQASWLGHSWDVHQRIYLRWLPPSRMRRRQQEQFESAQASVLTTEERQELEALRQQMAAMQKLLGGEA